MLRVLSGGLACRFFLNLAGLKYKRMPSPNERVENQSWQGEEQCGSKRSINAREEQVGSVSEVQKQGRNRGNRKQRERDCLGDPIRKFGVSAIMKGPFFLD